MLARFANINIMLFISLLACAFTAGASQASGRAQQSVDFVATGIDTLSLALGANNVQTEKGAEYVRQTLIELEDDWDVATQNVRKSKIVNVGRFADRLADGVSNLGNVVFRLGHLSPEFKHLGDANSFEDHLTQIQAAQTRFFDALSSKHITPSAFAKAGLSKDTFAQLAGKYHDLIQRAIETYSH
ncbi:hypothetical protein V8E36_003155 [Tilletia maclaganii]